MGRQTEPSSAHGAPRTPLERFEQALGERLMADGSVAAGALDAARRRMHRRGGRLTTCLLELGLVEEAPLGAACSALLGVPLAGEAEVAAARPEIRAVLSRTLVTELRVVPFARSGRALLVATMEPWRAALFEDLGSRTGLAVEPRFLDEGPLARVLERDFGIPAAPRFKRPPRRRPRARPPRAAGDGKPDDTALDGDPLADAVCEVGYEAPAPPAPTGGRRSRRTPGHGSGR